MFEIFIHYIINAGFVLFVSIILRIKTYARCAKLRII